MSAFSQFGALLDALPVQALRDISDGLNAKPSETGGAAGIGAKLRAAIDPVAHVAATPPKLSRAEQARVNGAKSRGPVTVEGKDRSRKNALRHGLRAEGLLTPDEDPAEYAAYLDDYRRELHAVGTVQTDLAERAGQMAWKLKRIPIIEAQVYAVRRETRGDPDLGLGAMGDLIHELIGTDEDEGAFNRLRRYEGRIERSLRGSLRELRLLQGQATAADRKSTQTAQLTPMTQMTPVMQMTPVSECTREDPDAAPGSFGAVPAPKEVDDAEVDASGCSASEKKNPGLREYAQTPASSPAPGSFGQDDECGVGAPRGDLMGAPGSFGADESPVPSFGTPGEGTITPTA